MRVGILTTRLPPDVRGGAETQAKRIAEKLSLSHDVRVFSRSTSGISPGPSLKLVSRLVVNLPLLRFVSDLAVNLFVLRSEWRQLDVIIAYQTCIEGVLAVLVKRLYGPKVIISVRSEAEFDFQNRLQVRLFTRFVFSRADRIALQSGSLAVALLNAFPSADRSELKRKLIELPNGVDLPDVGSSPRHFFLFVGRLVPDKGVSCLIDAMRGLNDERLLIVGVGDEEHRLKEAAGDNPRIEFLGAQSPEQVARLMREAKALILPSLRNEGVPNVVLEAMSHCTPVLATNHAGLPDLIVDGVNGLLAEPGDSASLRHCIEKLRQEPSVAKKLGYNGRRSVAHFNWPAVMKQVETVLRQLHEGSRL